MPWQSGRDVVGWQGMSVSKQPSAPVRPVIYQLLVRYFGNTNSMHKCNGTMAENGCGKFEDINDTALSSLREMGFNQVWLTGVLEQASGTAYPDRPPDPPDILKGIAGSPYAIRDYFDVCPDYAVVPAKRMEEFKALLNRCRAHGLRVILDFVPNHVARSYHSDVRPGSSFGDGDDTSVFFDRDNHFYYLGPDDAGGGPPLRLPTAGMPGCSGLFAPETEFGRVTGNNSVTWAPSIHDWYETVKLNYGHHFTQGRNTSALPGPEAAPEEVPRTWRTMDEILGYWQELGVDGFRCDMAHMIPMEFWHWAVRRARERQPDVFFTAEAYDGDPAKLTDGHVLDALLDAGFDAVYDDPSYKVVMRMHTSGAWANDLDAIALEGDRFQKSLHYVENHDEVRIASPLAWGGIGMAGGRAATAILFGMGCGPVMLYSGQEVGEPATGAAGFSGDDGRTTIFDYGAMPEFCKWVNGGKFDGGKLSKEQKALRRWYGIYIRATQSAAFTQGGFYGLNYANADNSQFGRIGDETVSGHWLYAFLRHDGESADSCLVVVNSHPSETLRGVHVHIPDHAWNYLGRAVAKRWKFTDRLEGGWSGHSTPEGIALPDLAPSSAMVLEISAD